MHIANIGCVQHSNCKKQNLKKGQNKQKLGFLFSCVAFIHE